jgi:hypothetical protein
MSKTCIEDFFQYAPLNGPVGQRRILPPPAVSLHRASCGNESIGNLVELGII